MNNSITPFGGVSSCVYSLDSGLLKIRGWLLPSSQQKNIEVYYNGSEITGITTLIARPDLQKKFSEINDEFGGWYLEKYNYTISKEKSKEVVILVKENGIVLFEMKSKIKFEGSVITDSDINGLTQSQYITVIGTIEPRKNYQQLYYVWKKLFRNKEIECPKLVIIGGCGYLSKDFMYTITNDPEVNENILILTNTSDSIKEKLIDHSLFTVYPSFYEGWGLPVAESLARGKMCLASKETSVPEIAGDIITYFSPYDIDECYERVLELIKNPKLVIELEARIHNSYQTTSWKSSTQQICESISQLL